MEKKIIGGFDADGKRIKVNENYSFPEYLIQYLYVQGIVAVNPDQGIYLYNNDESRWEQLAIKIIRDGFIQFYVPSNNNRYIAMITPGDNVFFSKDKYASIKSFDDGSGLGYSSSNNQALDIIIKKDLIGNASIALEKNGLQLKQINILVGEKHDTPQDYVTELIEQFDEISETEGYTERDKRLIYAMINDPRILSAITNLIDSMADSVDAAKEGKVKELLEEYYTEIRKLIGEVNPKYIDRLNAIVECSRLSQARLDELKGDAK